MWNAWCTRYKCEFPLIYVRFSEGICQLHDELQVSVPWNPRRFHQVIVPFTWRVVMNMVSEWMWYFQLFKKIWYKGIGDPIFGSQTIKTIRCGSTHWTRTFQVLWPVGSTVQMGCVSLAWCLGRTSFWGRREDFALEWLITWREVISALEDFNIMTFWLFTLDWRDKERMETCSNLHIC